MCCHGKVLARSLWNSRQNWTYPPCPPNTSNDMSVLKLPFCLGWNLFLDLILVKDESFFNFVVYRCYKDSAFLLELLLRSRWMLKLIWLTIKTIYMHKYRILLRVFLLLLEASTCWLSFELLSGSFFVLPLWHKLRLTAGLDCGQLCSLALSVRLSGTVCLSGNVRLSGTVCHELKLNFLRNLAPAGEMTSAITSWVTDSQPRACISISLASSQFPKYMANMKIVHKVYKQNIVGPFSQIWHDSIKIA